MLGTTPGKRMECIRRSIEKIGIVMTDKNGQCRVVSVGDKSAVVVRGSMNSAVYSLELVAHNNPDLIKKDIVITRNKKSIMWDVIDNNKKTFIDDFQSSIYSCGKKLYRDNFAISYPLAIDNNVFGVINMNNSNTGDIPEKLYKMAVNIEGHLASALSNSIAFKKLENLSNTDELTQLFNRRYLLNILQNELERAKRYKRNLSCIMIDIDRFKNINDNYGHLYGDFIVKKFFVVIIFDKV